MIVKVNFSKKILKKIEKKPFMHLVIDNFLEKNFLKKIINELPNFEDKVWHEYSNFCEVKKTCNQWNYFKPYTYKFFSYLNSKKFTDKLEKLFSDPGLHGAGIAMMKNNGGKLNPHLDNTIHPKNGMKRKYNLVIFLNKVWHEKWGGNLVFYKKNKYNKQIHGEISKKILPKLNRLVIFDTSQNSCTE